MSEEEPQPDPPLDAANLRSNWVENTEQYERALSALLTPRGERLTTLAERNEVDIDVLRTVARHHVRDNIILVESDGKPKDPRLHRNEAMGFFEQVWREFSHRTDRAALEQRLTDLEDTIAEYEEMTGYDSPREVEKRIGEEDLSHIETPDTGELTWDVITPWQTALHDHHVVTFALENYDTLEELAGFIDIDDVDAYGDFADINAISAKLGFEDHKSPVEIDEDGNLVREDEDRFDGTPL